MHVSLKTFLLASGEYHILRHCLFSSLTSSKANAGGSGRDTLQSARQPEESATAGAGATPTLPGQYKQRTPMYNASTTANPATPTSPSTPASTPASNGPPAAATASQPETPTQPPSTPQTPTPTPTPTPPQPQPKKNLSLTVRCKTRTWVTDRYPFDVLLQGLLNLFYHISCTINRLKIFRTK